TYIIILDLRGTGAFKKEGASMPTSNEYRQSAEECYRLAGGAETETDRLACLELARTWLEAASRRDEMTPEQIAEEEKLDNAWKRLPETQKHQTLSGWWHRVLGF
ncbi:MAG: hypothetical protein WBD33_09250, partial [Xanthobacteraceae bacterium]